MALASQIDAAARGDTKPATGDVFPRFLDTVQDATPAQWATFTVDVITHARRTDLSRAELLKVLDMLGVIGELRRHAFDGKPIPLRGRCTGCHTMQDLMRDGRRIASHKRNGQHWPGRHQPPAAKPREVA